MRIDDRDMNLEKKWNDMMNLSSSQRQGACKVFVIEGLFVVCASVTSPLNVEKNHFEVVLKHRGETMGNKKSRPIALNYSNRTGANMNYSTEVIGDHVSNCIPKALQNELKSECKALIEDKEKLNYRNPRLTNRNKLKCMKIQDLIEPCNPVLESLDNDPYANGIDPYGLIQITMSNANAPKPNSDSIHCYVPTIFQFDEASNSYKIEGEINDLPRQKHLELYKVIEKVFNCMERNISKCVSSYPKKKNVLSSYPFYGTSWPAKQPQSPDVTKRDKYYVVVKMTGLYKMFSLNLHVHATI